MRDLPSLIMLKRACQTFLFSMDDDEYPEIESVEPSLECCGKALGEENGFRVCRVCGARQKIEVNPVDDFFFQQNYHTRQRPTDAQAELLDTLREIWKGKPLSTKEIHTARQEYDGYTGGSNNTFGALETLQWSLPIYGVARQPWRLRRDGRLWSLWKKEVKK